MGLSSSDEDNLNQEDKENEVPRKTQPHLRFEITSEDGLNVQADSIEGKIAAVSSFTCGGHKVSPTPMFACFFPPLEYQLQLRYACTGEWCLLPAPYFSQSEIRCFILLSRTPCRPFLSSGAWKAVIEKVQEARTNARLKHLSFAGKGARSLPNLPTPLPLGA